MTESNDELFEMVRAAYVRGYNWGQENPDSRPFLNKAAYDYADKATSALALRTPSDDVKVKPLEWEKGTHWAQARCKAVGLLQVTHVGDGWDWRIGEGVCLAQCDSMDEAIAEVEEERKAAILSALTTERK